MRTRRNSLSPPCRARRSWSPAAHCRRPASAGKLSFDLNLAAGTGSDPDQTLAQDFTFNLALNIAPANRPGVGALTLIRPAGVTASHVTLTW